MDGVSRSGYPDDQEVAAGAKAWVDSVEGKWRVQIFARRSRVLRDGSSREIPSRLRRFVEGIPWAFVRPAVDYLISKAPYSGVIANGVDFGVTYRPTLTMWQRDSQQAAVGAKGASVGDATYTLVQDLVEADSDDVYTVGTSSSCSEEVVSRYVWDAASVEELPQGGMGVTYQVAQVHRNEDGSFDYALVKRVAITQHVGPVTQEDNAYRQVSVETWDNVYVRDDGVFCDSSWNPIAGIAAGVGDVDGRRVETKVEQVSENDDCTVRLSVTRTWLKPVTAQTETRNTQFESDRSVVTSGNDGSLGDAPDASDGVIVTHASELQPDGTYRNTVKTETERPVAGSRREVSRTSRAVRTVVHDANQAAPAPTEGLAVGQTVVVESTPGRLFNNTVTNVEAAATPDSARCAKTVFSHEHDAVTLHSGGSASDVLNGLSCSDAGGGVYRTVTADMDENGVVKRVERVTHELSQPDAEVRRERTSRATRTTVVNKNAASGYDAETPVAIGETKASSLNPGGTYDTTHVIVAASETPDSARCAKTVFSHEHDAVTLHSGASASDVLNNLSCSDAGGGVYRTVTADMDENGVVKRVERVTHELSQPDAEVRRERTSRATRTTVVNKNAASGYDAETPVAIGETKASSLNPGGTYDTTHVIVAASETPDSARCAKTVFSHEHDAVTLHSGASASDVLNNLSCSDAGGGVYRTVTADMDENGVVKRVERVTHESYFPQSEETRDTDAFHSALTVKDTHASASSGGSVYDDVAATIGASPSGDSVSDSDPVRTNSVSVKTRAVSAATQGGSRDVVKVTDTPLFRQWYDYLDTDLYKTFVFYFRNATTAQRNVVRNRATAKWNELRNLYGGVKGSLDLTAAEAAAVGQMVILKSGAGYRYAVKHDDGKWYIGTNEVSGTDLDDINKALKGSESDTSELSGTDRIWAGGPKTPTSARITPSCTLNEHGLFDGHYTIELAWSPESGGSQVDHVNGNVALAKWTYRVYSCSYSVRTFGSNGNNMEIVKTAQSKLVAEEMVTGWKSYVNRCFGPNNLLFEGSHVSVTPSTGVAHGVRVLEADTVIEKFETRSQWVKEGWGKVLPWNKIIMRPATITLDDSVSGGIGGV